MMRQVVLDLKPEEVEMLLVAMIALTAALKKSLASAEARDEVPLAPLQEPRLSESS